MAVLATLQDADVLPPEDTPEANRVIKAVIQFQSVFLKSSDPAVQSLSDSRVGRTGRRQRRRNPVSIPFNRLDIGCA